MYKYAWKCSLSVDSRVATLKCFTILNDPNMGELGLFSSTQKSTVEPFWQVELTLISHVYSVCPWTWSRTPVLIRTPAVRLKMYFHGADRFVLGSQWEDVTVCDFNLWQEKGGSGSTAGSTFSQLPQTCSYRLMLLLIIWGDHLLTTRIQWQGPL